VLVVRILALVHSRDDLDRVRALACAL
jgi:hypothetical protein